MRPRRAFTIIELLVVMGILALLMSLLIPAIERAREVVRRASCQAQLKGLGLALHAYAAAMNEKWPDAGTKAGKVDTVGSLWLLVRYGQAQPDNFICPTDKADRRVAIYRGEIEPDKPFPLEGDRLTLSYSYQVPHSIRGNPGQDNAATATRFAVMADRSPFDPRPNPPAPGGRLISNGAHSWAGEWNSAPKSSGEDVQKFLKTLGEEERLTVNSPNHRGGGQNVLYRDGHAAWAPTPVVGIDFDNIYTRRNGGSLLNRAVGATPNETSLPYDNDDSYLRTYRDNWP